MSFENLKFFAWFWLVLPWLIFWYLRYQKRINLLKPWLMMLSAGTMAQHLLKRHFFQGLFFFLACLSFGVALLKPFKGVETYAIHQKGVAIYLLVDVSPSMLAQDIAPSRIESVRYKILDFLKILQGDRVGLIAFSGLAYSLTPLTSDYETLAQFVSELNPHYFEAPGTDIQAAVELAMPAFEKSGATSAKAIILFSDGEDSLGLNEDQIQSLKDLNVPIFAVGVGSAAGAPIPEKAGGYKKGPDGERVLSRLNEAALKEIALSTQGGYVPLTLDNQDIQALYINGIKKSMSDSEWNESQKVFPNYRFTFFIALGLFFFLLECLAYVSKIKGQKKALFILFLFFSQTASAKNVFKFNEADKAFEAMNYSESLDLLNELKADSETDTEIDYNLGNTYYKLQQYDLAHESYVKALDSDDFDTRLKALYNLGNTAFQKGRYQEALEYYEQSLAMNPKHEPSLHNAEIAKQKLQEEKQKSEEENKSENQEKPEDKAEDKPEADPNQSKNSDEPQKANENPSEDSEDPSNSNPEESPSDKAQDPQTQPKDSQSEEGQSADNQTESPEAAADDLKNAEALNSDADQTQKPDLEKTQNWINALKDSPQNAIKAQIKKKSLESKKKFDKDW